MAEVLIALQAPPDRREVAGWGEALTVYRELAERPATPGRPGVSRRSRSRRPRPIARPLGARLAAAAGAAAIAVFGAGAAAYTGSLPAGLQKFAHAAIAAPGVRGSSAASAPEGTGGPRGPSVPGPAAYGLCNAYQHAEEHGTATVRAVAFRNLVRAAGGPDKVAAYCAAIPHPGSTNPPGRRVGQSASPSAAKHGRKPTAPPGKPTAPPGKPTAPPGKPTKTPGQGNGNGKGNGPEEQS